MSDVAESWPLFCKVREEKIEQRGQVDSREEDSEADFLHITPAAHSLESVVLGVTLPAVHGACPAYTL